MFIEDIVSACCRVINGDEDALEELGLHTINYIRPGPFNDQPIALQSAYNHALHLAIAARELDMATLQMQTQMTLMMILAVAQRQNINIEHRIEGADVAEIMLSLIDEEAGRLRTIQNNNRADDISDADDSTSSVVIPNLVNAPPTIKCTPTPSPSPATSHPSATATSLPLPSIPAPCPSAPQPSSPSTPSVSTAPSNPYAKPASNNKRRHCSLCSFFGTHLQRHLRQQHSGSFTTNAEKMKLVHANDKLNTSQPSRRFQCTF